MSDIRGRISELGPYLDDLAARIDESEEERLHSAWIDFLDGRLKGVLGPEEPFVPPKRTPQPPRIEWPEVHINDALGDIPTMILHQLSMASKQLAAGGSAVLNIRSNYGVSIMTSQLGCEVVVMPREHHNLPTTRPLAPTTSDGDRESAVRRAVEGGVPDLRAGQGGDVFDCGEELAQVLASNDVLGRWVHLYHPDAQGPIDNAELAWGPEMFLAFYDTPELVHQFLDLMVEHYLAFLRAWFQAHPPRGAYSTHWGYMIKGQVMLRDDSLMNLSPEVYDEFIFQRERRCINELGGGVIHYCGRGSHVIDRFSSIEGLTGVNLSQPHLNEMDAVYDGTIAEGVNIIGLPRDGDGAVPAADGRDLRGRVHLQS